MFAENWPTRRVGVRRSEANVAVKADEVAGDSAAGQVTRERFKNWTTWYLTENV